MSFREWYKKKTMPRRKRTVKELEKIYKKKKYMLLSWFGLAVVFLLCGVSVLFVLVDSLSYVLVNYATNTMLYVLIVGTSLMNILFLFYIKYVIYALDEARDRDILEILILLKEMKNL